MKLTQEQKAMLDGAYGKGKAMAMQIQAAVGESFEAERMVPITRAHVALSAQEADTWFAEKLLAAGASCAVPPTVNPGFSLEYFGKKGLPDEAAAAHMRKTHRVYQELGAILTYSCTPYLFDNIPRYGERVAFSETSATIYVNSVLGARTNRESSASALCAAVTGYAPEYGMLLSENRLGTVEVRVEAPVQSEFDYACLGLLGKKIGKGIPVFTGLSPDVSTEALIALGAQLNVSGMYELYHIAGVTPDAPTAEAAFGGKKPQRVVTVTKKDLDEALEHYSPSEESGIEFVILGCPHYTYRQIEEVDRLLDGGCAKIPVWILTSGAVTGLSETTGLRRRLEEKGVELIADTCVDQACCWKKLTAGRGITDSPKSAYYMATFGTDMVIRDRETCIRWALGGRR